MKFVSIKSQFFIIFLIISIIPILIITEISYESYTRLVSEHISLSATNSITNSTERFSNVMNDIERNTVAFQQYSMDNSALLTADSIHDELVKYADSSEDADQYDLYTSWTHLNFLCNNIMNNYDYIDGIFIFTTTGDNIGYGRTNDLMPFYHPTEDQWFLDTINQHGELYISDVSPKDFLIEKRNSIFFARSLYNLTTYDFIGVIMIVCNTGIFDELNRDSLPETTGVFLLNDDGNIAYSDNSAKIGTPFSDTPITELGNTSNDITINQSGNILTLYKQMPDCPWKVAITISLSNIEKKFDSTKHLLIRISFVTIILILLTSLLLSRRIIQPITDLSRQMKLKKAHLPILKDKNLQRRDEVGILYQEYNQMLAEIDRYIKERYQNKLITLDSQMRALEAQINSHFLYNTLESMNAIAVIEDVPEIALLSKALGDMFRFAIKTESELVTLKDELLHTINYLEIQKIRYHDQFEYYINIDDALNNEQTLKLILQPLVENALFHGVEKKKSKSHICINGKMDDSALIIEIIDDGVGVPPHRVEQINALLQTKPEITDLGKRKNQSIGIKNIQSRIQLYYGDAYGLVFESQLNIGTHITITLPRQRS